MPWAVGNSSFYESVIQAIADRYEIPTDKPWQELTEEQQGYFLYGTDGDTRLRHLPQPDGPAARVHDRVRGHRRLARAPLPRDRQLRRSASGSRSTCRSGRARSARARGSSPRCSRSRSASATSTSSRSSRSRRRSGSSTALELTATEELIGARIVKEIRERLTFLDNVGVGYLALDRASATLSGGEAQRLRLATQIGSQLVGVLYILDEPSIGLHQRDNDRLIGDARAAARPRQHRDRRRARRADDAERRLARRHGPGRRRARRPRRRRGHGGEGRAEPEVGHRPVPLRHARDRGARAADRRQRRLHRARRARSTT